MAGAANLAGFVPEEIILWLCGKLLWAPLAERHMGMVLKKQRSGPCLQRKERLLAWRSNIEGLGMDPRTTVYVGGGGGLLTNCRTRLRWVAVPYC